MKQFAAKAVRIGAAAGMLASLVMVPAISQPQNAEAGNMNWERGTTLHKTSGDPFTTVAVANDGTVFAANGLGPAGAATVSNRIFRSSDNGKSWTNCGDLVGVATSTGGILEILPSPQYNTDSTILVLVASNASPVYISTSTCSSFTGSSTLLGGATAMSFSVNSNFSGRDGGTLLVGTRGAGGNNNVQTMAVPSGGSLAGAFVATIDATPTADDTAISVMVNRDGSFARWIACGLTAGASSCGAGNLREDRASATGAWINGVVTAFSAFTPAGGVTNLTVNGFTNVRLRIAKPSDIERDGRNYYFSVGGTATNCTPCTAAAGKGVYKRDGAVTGAGAATAVKPGDFATKPVSNFDITGIAIRGTFDSGTIVGVIRDSTRILKSTNGGSTWGTSKDMEQTDHNHLDTGVTQVGYAHYLDISFDPNTSFAFAVSTAKPVDNLTTSDGGILWSNTSGDSWGDTGLTNRDLSNALGSISAVTDQILQSRAGATSLTRQMFQSETNSVVSGTTMSSSWRRLIRWGDVSTVTKSPNYDTDGTAIIYRDTVTTDASKVQKTTNKGITWSNCSSTPGDKKLNDRDLSSASTFSVADDEGYIWITTDGCNSWVRSDTKLGQRVNSSGPFSNTFATDNTLYATAVDTSGNVQAFWSKDGGKTFSQIGTNSGAWGSCTACGTAPTTAIYLDRLFATNGLIYFKSSSQSIVDLWRFDTTNPSSVWVRMFAPGDSGTNFATSSPIRLPNVWITTRSNNDGTNCTLVAPITCNANGQMAFNYNFRTTDSTTQNKDWWFSEAIPGAVVTVGPGGGVAPTANGMQPGINAWTSTTVGDGTLVFARVAGSTAPLLNPDVMLMLTLNSDFLKGLSPNAPADKSTVPSNVGQNGQPVVFSWTSFGPATCYELQVALDPKFDSVTALGAGVGLAACPAAGAVGTAPTLLGVATTGSALSSGTNIFSDGVTYYWRTRVLQTNSNSQVLFSVGPWSAARSFTPGLIGAPTAPQPNLPLNGSQLPGLTTELSWNNPGGTAQVQVQITPLNGDGPAINLIIGAPIQGYTVPAPVFGTGPYVMLPGATYTWRVRTTRSVSAGVSEQDASWGPWSEPRTFTTRRPDAGTLQLISPINGGTATNTPSVSWKDAAADQFYYEVQLSADPNFNTDPRSATAAVFYNLVHGGESNPPDSWKVPDAAALKAGTFYWRIRPRLQATPAGSAEVGVAWSPAQRFVVP